MSKNRLEAFSDGVIAIIITIMVLELKVPHGTTWQDLQPLLPVFLSYVLSFIYIAIYWNNHHHMMQSVQHVDGSVLWANAHLLFWLSLVPFGSGWMGENYHSVIPVAVYGFLLLMSGVAYTVLALRLVAIHGKESLLGKAIGSDQKGKISLVFYVMAICLAFVNTKISLALYAIVACIWFIPDSRIEKRLKGDSDHSLS